MNNAVGEGCVSRTALALPIIDWGCKNMTNIVLSWLSAALVVLLMIIWPLRLLCTKSRFKDNRTLKKLWRVLRKIHAPLGIITTVIVFMHCSVAERATGINSLVGAILLVCMLGLCMTWFLKRLMPRYWLMLHRGITIIMFVALMFHGFIEFNL